VKSQGRRWLAAAVALLGLMLIQVVLAAAPIEGRVFLDLNRNSIYEESEPGLAGVVVSNGLEIVLTDADGFFVLEPDPEAKFVFISIPSGYLPVDGWYRKIPQEVGFEFPMKVCSDDSPLTFVQISDAHYATNPEEFRKAFHDREMRTLPHEVFDDLIAEVNAIPADFVILAGDIIASAARRPPIELVEKWMEHMADEFAPRFDAPFFAMVGNHDVVRDETDGKWLYEKYFGPTYYSFNMKGVHFVALDTQQIIDGKLVYTVSPRQLVWLKRNLAATCPQAPVVVFSHSPSAGWDDTQENEALLDLLVETGIIALLGAHWHINFRFPQLGFYELISGAVSGAWWEGEAPDGSGFGYRVFQINRSRVKSIWREIGASTVDLSAPRGAVVTWHDVLHAAVWGEAKEVSWRIGDGPALQGRVFYNGLWSRAYGNLNFSTLENGFHSIAVEFQMADGGIVSYERPLYVTNPGLTIAEIRGHYEAFIGRVVAVPRLEVRATIGRAISASDGTATIIIDRFLVPVQRGDVIGIMGIYRQHVTAPILPFDPVFFTFYEE